MSYSQTGYQSTKRQERTVTFVFPHTSGKHCAGINSVVVSHDETLLWTASRDSLIKRWCVSGPEPALEADFEGHIDWVNAIVALERGMLVSASSDKTLRTWNALSEAPVSDACYCEHTDYINSLAAATTRPVVVSGGLGGQVLLWDLGEAGRACAKIEGVAGSVYSLTCDASATVVAAGTADGCIWLVDSRTGRAEAQLRGHSATARALCMPGDASTLVSGSSDHTIRAWDLRQRRTAHTLAVHTDSVWALAPGDTSLSVVYSGGRDGCVYRTHLATRVSEVVAEESKPVTALAVCPASDAIWVATTSSTLRRWEGCGAAPDAPPPQPGHPHTFVAGSLPAVRARNACMGGEGRPLLRPAAAPAAEVAGAPPVRQVAVLTDRRHVLTQDVDGQVLLWDLSEGAPVRDLGAMATLLDAERELFDPAHNVWPWFQPDTRLGCLAGVMESPGCFLAEAYRRDLGDVKAAADAKVNMAQHMLGALFGHWAERKQAAEAERDATAAVAAAAAAAAPALSAPLIGAGSVDRDTPMQEERGGGDSTKAMRQVLPSKQPARARPPSFSLRSQLAPVIMISEGNGVPPWRRRIDEFDGTEAEDEMVPRWVGDCVLRGRVPPGKDLKMAFTLTPTPNSKLPSLLQSRLNAPRVLTVDKVADYVMRKMEEEGVSLAEEPLFWSAEKHEMWEAEKESSGGESPGTDAEGGSGRGGLRRGGNGSAGSALGAMGIRQLRPAAPPLLITCGGAAVPWDFTLAAVKQWMWKRSEDLRLEYGIRAPGQPLRPPIIRPPV